MVQKHAELEIVLRWRADDDVFDVGLAYDDPSDPQDRRDYVDEPLKIDIAALGDVVVEPEQYGRAVGALLTGMPKVRTFFGKALATAAERDIPLHLRLVVDPRAPMRYHEIHWEAMRDPDDGSRISTRRNILFSRYLSTPDWRPVRPPPWHRLTALVAIANPSDLSTKKRVGMPEVPLHEIDVPGELARAREALRGMDVVELVEPGQATLPRILAELERGVDLCYLVCHGGIYENDPRLYLENAAGMTAVASGIELAERVAELDRPPTVAVLCSCQSAGRGDEATASDDGRLSALGPRLAAAGVGAVVGMQGNVTMTTAATFLPVFFRELGRDGVVDRAMAVARAAVVHREHDWWMPVLFTRLRLGRAWYQPEFGAAADEAFRALNSSIAAGACTPVIGSGVAGEEILPSREELAANWADQWLMPIAPQNRVDLAKVAQYLSVRTAPRLTQTEICLYLASELRGRFGDELPEEVRDARDLVDPGSLIRAVGRRHREQAGELDPYAILASLRQPIYVTTAWGSLLEDAIEADGHVPTVRAFDWREGRNVGDLPTPTADRPLVFHLFGTLDDPASLVVTEDHYFQWLTAWIRLTEKPESIPPCVAKALTDSALLFVGYRLDDWEFRVLFQGIKSFPAAAKGALQDNFHVGVQVSPESTAIEPESVQDYLAKYFGATRVSIYWGTCTRFLTDLAERRRPRDGR